MKRRLPAYLAVFISSAAYLIAGVAPSQTPAATHGVAAQSQRGSPSAGLPAIGPKKRIAVIKFDVGVAVPTTGATDLGSGLAAELTTALINTGQFIVIERSELASVLREQEMSMQKLVSSDTAVQAGHLLGAQYLVRASVTEFEQSAGGGGLHIGVGGAGGAGAVGIATNVGVVGIDLRLIDTTTGQVVQSRHAEAKVEDRGISADVGTRGVSFGGDAFAKTPLGRATQQAIDQAVVFVVDGLRPLPWTGRVVDASADQVFINAGASAGIKPGDRFTVSTITRQLTDPATGALLGVTEERLGDVEIVDIQEQYSIARLVAPFATKRGDLVRSATSS